MGVTKKKSDEGGFAVVEAVLLVILAAAIVGIGAYVVHQKHKADKTLSGSTAASTNKVVANGSTASIDQLAQQDATSETNVDAAADGSYQQAATSSNTAVSNVGGAYNESSY